MTVPAENKTAVLAMVFGAALFAACLAGEAHLRVDPRTLRELAVLSRVLEKRLGEAREALGTAVPQSPCRDAVLAKET